MDILAKLKMKWYNTNNKQVQDALTDANAEITQLRAELAREDKAHGSTIDERDHAESMADKLAFAIGGLEVGEHSSINCPWTNAIEMAHTLHAELTAERELSDRLREDHETSADRFGAIVDAIRHGEGGKLIRSVIEDWQAQSRVAATRRNK